MHGLASMLGDGSNHDPLLGSIELGDLGLHMGLTAPHLELFDSTCSAHSFTDSQSSASALHSLSCLSYNFEFSPPKLGDPALNTVTLTPAKGNENQATDSMRTPLRPVVPQGQSSASLQARTPLSSVPTSASKVGATRIHTGRLFSETRRQLSLPPVPSPSAQQQPQLHFRPRPADNMDQLRAKLMEHVLQLRSSIETLRAQADALQSQHDEVYRLLCTATGTNVPIMPKPPAENLVHSSLATPILDPEITPRPRKIRKIHLAGGRSASASGSNVAP